MKLVIDIPEKDYKNVSSIVDMGLGTNVDEAIKNGTPLDDVMVKIEQIYQDIDTCSHNEYENAVEQGKETAYENVLSILDNIGKAESGLKGWTTKEMLEQIRTESEDEE